MYRPGGAEARLHIRDAHVEYMIANRNVLEQGGALLAADGTVEGMFLILRHDSREAVEAFLTDEPYSRAGLFATTTIETFDRFVPHADPRFLDKLLVAARDWIARNCKPLRADG
ncbi:MAG: hypothetical protein HZA66_08150 [Rhodopseudomonas palustris]|uniref:YCII-related domain-containing protein n=1 Tax=Rhodopseudomonas palustris TaxID=1076 RepID=A0A933RVH2_RHOPL|nr:hypothetical protein [Rhodopseudomonas palustris]